MGAPSKTQLLGKEERPSLPGLLVLPRPQGLRGNLRSGFPCQLSGKPTTPNS